MPNLILKKPSELDEVIQIESIHMTPSGNGIACWCPGCGVEVEFVEDWPIDIRTVCDSNECDTIFIITNDTPIIL